MPSMPPRPCTAARCNNMATKRGKCKDHQPIPWKTSIGKTPTERGYGHAWRKIRIRALKRDGHLCQNCIADNIISEAKEVDHVIPKSRGGTDALENLMSLCVKCHRIKTNKER